MRHLIFPILLAAAIIIPALLNNDSWIQNPDRSTATAAYSTASASGGPFWPMTSSSQPANLSPNSLSVQKFAGQNAARYAAYPISTVPVAPPDLTLNANPAHLSLSEFVGANTYMSQMSSGGMPPTSDLVNGLTIRELNSGKTVILPGDARGPNFSATPMEFMPTNNLAEVFRLDVNPNWVKSRWQRVSTSPGEYGLHGLRVPLVTGVNRSDLHGSLTYYFDANKTAQRITFRGWTGDATRLVGLLEKNHGLKRQPSHWAGFYLAQTRRKKPTGALLMQHPQVIRSENPGEQIAIILEVNNPQGRFLLSDEIKSLILVAQAAQ